MHVFWGLEHPCVLAHPRHVFHHSLYYHHEAPNKGGFVLCVHAPVLVGGGTAVLIMLCGLGSDHASRFSNQCTIYKTEKWFTETGSAVTVTDQVHGRHFYKQSPTSKDPHGSTVILFELHLKRKKKKNVKQTWLLALWNQIKAQKRLKGSLILCPQYVLLVQIPFSSYKQNSTLTNNETEKKKNLTQERCLHLLFCIVLCCIIKISIFLLLFFQPFVCFELYLFIVND